MDQKREKVVLILFLPFDQHRTLGKSVTLFDFRLLSIKRRWLYLLASQADCGKEVLQYM